MPRPRCLRRVHRLPGAVYFKPRGIPLVDLEEVGLALDEFEAIRLADLQGLYQDQAAEQMGISRPTFGRIIEAARRKVADALYHGKALRIEGGEIIMASKRMFRCSDCQHAWEVPFGTGRPAACPQCQSKNLHRAEEERGQARSSGAGCGRRLRRGKKE
ncbi:MAG: DUF134 domain-containing protein [candidate division Zixibacteria bacterium]|nr:DUF134 domain-containing protein [candidate division Zixibacteria bacterium]